MEDLSPAQSVASCTAEVTAARAANKMRYNLLGKTGMKVSHVGLGGAPFSDIYGSFEEDHGLCLIRLCLKYGMNYFETGPWYGQGTSERTMGKALSQFPRSSYYMASKVGRYDRNPETMFDFSAEKTEFGVNNTLELLGMDYVDVIQVHDFSFAPSTSIILNETLPTLQKAVDDGKARFIGLADYNLDLIKEIVEESEVKISVILSYAKSTFFDNRLQNYTQFFKRRGIGVINASATGMGLLTNKGPPDWHPANSDMKELCLAAATLCRKYNVELGRLATHFSINQPNIDTHVLGITNVHQLFDTVKMLYHGLTETERFVFGEIVERYFSFGTMHWDHVNLAQHLKSRILQD